MRTALVSFLLVGCAAAPDPVVVEITGTFERAGDDPAAPWLGAETRELTDAAGSCLLEIELEADAVEGACDDCALVLHVTQATERSRTSACEVELAEGPDVARNFAFRPTRGDDGEVLVADEPSGPWERWSQGTLADGRLEYDHRALPDADRGLDLDDLRPLHGRPVQQ